MDFHAFHSKFNIFNHQTKMLAVQKEQVIFANNTTTTSIDNYTGNDWYLVIWSIYVMPVQIVIGLVCNALVAAVMLRATVLVPPRIKRLYVTIAVFDWLTIFTIFLFYYLEDGLYLTTGGRFMIHTRSLGTWACKLLFFFYFSSMLTSCFFLAYLTFERMVAVCFPLGSKLIFQVRFHYLYPLSIVVPIVASMGFSYYLMFDIRWLPDGRDLCFMQPMYVKF